MIVSSEFVNLEPETEWSIIDDFETAVNLSALIKNSSATKDSDRNTIEGQSVSSMNWIPVKARVILIVVHPINIQNWCLGYN